MPPLRRRSWSSSRTIPPAAARIAATGSSIPRWISAAPPTASTPNSALGDLPPELIAQKEDLLKDRVAIEMKRYFGKDFKRIGHATRVARYAEEMAKKEKGNLAVILSAAYLHDIGIQEAERKVPEHGRPIPGGRRPAHCPADPDQTGRPGRSDRGSLRYRRPSPPSPGEGNHQFQSDLRRGPDRQPGGKSEGKGLIPGTAGLDY